MGASHSASPSHQPVRLEEIPTWAKDFNENRVKLAEYVASADDETRKSYSVDWEINSRVSLYEGDITCIEADGIVSCNNSRLKTTGRIRTAIEKTAGKGLTEEFAKLNGCQIGEAKITEGYNLPAKYIVHTVGPKDKNEQLLDKCYTSCLEQMKEKQMNALVFCCISTGAFGFPKEKAAKVALKRVRLWLEDEKKSQSLDPLDSDQAPQPDNQPGSCRLNSTQLDKIGRIVFCLFTPKDVSVYKALMQIYFPCGSEDDYTQWMIQQVDGLIQITTLDPAMITFDDDPQNMRAKMPCGHVIDTLASSPVENATTSYSVPNRDNVEDNIASVEDSVQEQQELRPLPGFIELTTEPDMITLDDDPNTMRARMPCGHVIGPDSMTTYFRDILDKGKFKFICPSTKCDGEWEYFLVRHVARLSVEEMQKFEKELEHNFLQKEQGNQMCPLCKTWCTRDSGTGNRVRCQICTRERGKKFDFCWVCLKEWKRIRSSGRCGNPGCDGKDKRIHTLANCPTKTINICFGCPIIRGCPKCGSLIEHKDKCGHVSCPNCHCKFCFICLNETKDEKDKCTFLGTCTLAPRQA